MRLFYQHFDGQDPLARDGIVAGLRMLTLREVVEEYLEREQARACEAPEAPPASAIASATSSTVAASSPRPERQSPPAELGEELLEELDDPVEPIQLMALTEQSGFRRYYCAASTGAVWLEAGFNVCFVAKSLTEFLASQPGSRLRGNLQRGSRQRGNRQGIR